MTAAHCINARLNQKDYRIRLGDWHRFYPDGSEQVRRASKLIVHSAYNKPSLINNDIALIKLDKPALLNSHVSTVCLPSSNVNVSLESTCFITGVFPKKSYFFPFLSTFSLVLISFLILSVLLFPIHPFSFPYIIFSVSFCHSFLPSRCASLFYPPVF